MFYRVSLFRANMDSPAGGGVSRSTAVTHVIVTRALSAIAEFLVCVFTVTLYGHIKTAEQRTIIHQYGDWYTGHWWVGCYIWYSEEGPGRGRSTK